MRPEKRKPESVVAILTCAAVVVLLSLIVWQQHKMSKSIDSMRELLLADGIAFNAKNTSLDVEVQNSQLDVEVQNTNLGVEIQNRRLDVEVGNIEDIDVKLNNHYILSGDPIPVKVVR